MQPPPDLSPVIFPALTTLIAFGLITVAANALSNFAGTKLYDRERNQSGDFEFLHASDSAQQLRKRLSRFPGRMMGLYFLFLILVVSFGWWALSRLQSQHDISVLIAFIPVTALVYITLIVYMTGRISSMLYKVFLDTGRT